MPFRDRLPTWKGTKKTLKAFAHHPATYATLFGGAAIATPALVRFSEAGAGFKAAEGELISFANSIRGNSTVWFDAVAKACLSIYDPDTSRDPALDNYPEIKRLADHPFWTGLANAFNGTFDYGTDVALAAGIAAVLFWNYRKTTHYPTVRDTLEDTKKRRLPDNIHQALLKVKIKEGLKQFLITLKDLVRHVPKLVWLYSAVVLTIEFLNIFYTDRSLGAERAADQFCKASNHISAVEDFHNPFEDINLSESMDDFMRFIFASLSSTAAVILPMLTLYLAAVRQATNPDKAARDAGFTVQDEEHNIGGESGTAPHDADGHSTSADENTPLVQDKDEDHLYGCFAPFYTPSL